MNNLQFSNPVTETQQDLWLLDIPVNPRKFSQTTFPKGQYQIDRIVRQPDIATASDAISQAVAEYPALFEKAEQLLLPEESRLLHYLFFGPRCWLATTLNTSSLNPALFSTSLFSLYSVCLPRPPPSNSNGWHPGFLLVLVFSASD